jgi:hypothetical protein
MNKTCFQIISILVLLVTVVPAQASQTVMLVPAGQFNFNGEIEVISTKQTEFVETFSQAGKNRLKELQSKNWTCQKRPSNMYKCTIFLKDQKLPAEMFENLKAKYFGFSVYFSPNYSLSLVTETDFITEYEVSQDVKFKNMSVKNYLMRIMKDGPTKMQFPIEGEQSVYLNVLDSATVVVIETLFESNKVGDIAYVL